MYDYDMESNDYITEQRMSDLRKVYRNGALLGASTALISAFLTIIMLLAAGVYFNL